MNEPILINISGLDRPGLTTSITELLGRFNVQVLDISQSVIHNFLSLGILIRVPDGFETSPVLKDLLLKAHELDVTVSFDVIEKDKYQSWVSEQNKERYIVTILGRSLLAKHLSLVTNVIAENNLNIDSITRLSGRISVEDFLTPARSCIELSVSGKMTDALGFRESLLDIAAETGVDTSFQKDDPFRRTRRLVAFDMDSTLIQAEVIDELAKENNVGDEVSKITESAMRGEIDFQESFKKRVSLLKGLSESALENVARRLPITEGLERAMSVLKSLGFKTAIISGGFTYFGNFLQNKLGFDYVHANQLEIVDGVLTGKHVGEIIDSKRKAEILKSLAKKENIELAQTIAVGDGANDLEMLSVSGLGIAFHAKPIVRDSAEHSISVLGLDGILYLMGIRDREFV